MRVRCDKCGMKALVAASQCPHCGHLFELRDGFGDLLPLAHCTTCDTYYARREGACRWCGTKPDEGVRIGPYVWKGMGGVALVGVVLVAWLSSRSSGEDVATSQSLMTKTAESRTTIVDSGIAPRTFATVDSALTISEAVPTSVVAADAMALDSVGRDTTLPSHRTIEPAPLLAPTVAAVRARPAKASAPPRRNTRWVGAVARQWITVRAAAAHSARFVASIGPDTRVQLGEARGEWRRVRMKGISGWVERNQF